MTVHRRHGSVTWTEFAAEVVSLDDRVKELLREVADRGDLAANGFRLIRPGIAAEAAALLAELEAR